MNPRLALALACGAALVAVAGSPATAPVESASGSAHWTIPLPNDFDVEVVNRTLSFNARQNADGSVGGHFEYHQVVEGEAFKFNVSVTCLNVYDGHRAKLGGVIQVSNDPTLPVGTFAWFQVFDNGEGANAPRRPVEPDRFRQRSRQRGVLQQPESAALRSLGRPGQRAGGGLARVAPGSLANSPAIPGGGEPGMTLEGAREMALVGEAGLSREHRERRLRRGELGGGPVEPDSPQVLADAEPVALPEAAREVHRMHARRRRKLVERRALAQARVQALANRLEPRTRAVRPSSRSLLAHVARDRARSRGPPPRAPRRHHARATRRPAASLRRAPHSRGPPGRRAAGVATGPPVLLLRPDGARAPWSGTCLSPSCGTPPRAS